MNRSYFTNTLFYWVIILILSLLLIWNLYLTFAYSRLAGLLPIAIQVSLLALILKKHEFAKNGIKIWAIIFLIAGPGLQFLGRLLRNLAESFTSADLQYYITTGATILVGVAILYYTNKTVEVVETVEEGAESDHS
ncbi:hypothetical protein A3841_11155 [Pontibacter flavimaris]|uniref:Uncharacterized protein n=1 Tax=Pontibacter flavimaris TaxID=1797110 RepID=A0A1Q5PH81_9BACT|nr:hypothetical protein A3841_11155 [Pontibacter flavimaris]